MAEQQKTDAGKCSHRRASEVRLLTYTSYGAMVGCLRCGIARLIHPDHPGEYPTHRGRGG